MTYFCALENGYRDIPCECSRYLDIRVCFLSVIPGCSCVLSEECSSYCLAQLRRSFIWPNDLKVQMITGLYCKIDLFWLKTNRS